ncbi:MAG: DHH family phosphoesterase [Ruminococcus sp.]|nr:DHH family phosphoesterase [Ruminococcus sp.]
MTDKLKETAAFLRERDCFDILTHDYPDGDTLGSGFALCLALQQMGKKARVITTFLPKDFVFLTNEIREQDFETQTVVTVDVADVRLLGKNRAAYEGRIDLCIDHHMTNVVDAPLRLVDGHAAANCAILYKLFREMGITWTRAIANCLYTGISTDTGCFRYTNTTAETLRIGADIIDIGCDTAYINKVMFETKTKKKLALEREVYDTIEYCFDDRCAIIAVTCDMQRSIGVSDGELEGLASIPRQIEGVEIGITLREKAPGEFKVSVRTNGQVSASALCATLGGGGHSAAAGCTVKGTLDEAKAQLKAAAAKFL